MKGRFGIQERDAEGQLVSDLVKKKGGNGWNATFSPKRPEHPVTDSRTCWLATSKEDLKQISDCQAAVGEGTRQHRMVFWKTEPRAKWLKLRKEGYCVDFREALGGQEVMTGHLDLMC